MEQKKLILIDAFALIYRSYYAFIRNPRYNSKGLNTSAIFGFTNALIEIIKKLKPSHLGIVFDPQTLTFRSEIYPLYKAQREETPEDIRKSIPYIKQVAEAFKIPCITVDRYEADDVIGTLSLKAKDQGFVTYMFTPDKDYAQLVEENIFICKPGKGSEDYDILGIKEVNELFSISNPKQVIDILALWGDASDNIPGAQGIGEKTAKKLIAQFGSVENLIDNANQLQGKVKESILKNQEIIRLSKTLVTIERHVDVELNENELIVNEPDKEKVKTIFEELEFRTLINRVFAPEKKIAAAVPQQASLFPDMMATAPVVEEVKTKNTIHSINHNYVLIDTTEKLSQLVSDLNQQKEFCFDTETTGLEVHIMELVGISICYKDHDAYYIPVPAEREEAQKIVDQLKVVFENENIVKIGQNIKFDMLVLQAYGVYVKGNLFDTMLAHYIIQPELRHNMDYLAEQYLNYTPISIEELIGKKGVGQGNMRNVVIEKITDYAAEDADITWQLSKILKEEINNNKLNELADTVEMPLIEVLAGIEATGVKIQSTVLQNYSKVLEEEIRVTEEEIIALSGGEPFNISSPKQLGEVLFERMKIIDNAQKTKTNQYSTGEEVLEKLVDVHPIIPKILEHRSLKKLFTGYVETLPKLVNSKTGKIHTTYNQALTSTGRLSSNNPNLQNIPIRDERGREIRKAFIPSDSDHVLLSADYSQIELRLMAHMSGDEAMIDAFLHSADIHQATAAKIYGIAAEEVTSDMRRKAKTANFGIIYGISVFGLSQRLAISRSEAKELIDGYFATYPGVKTYMSEAMQKAREQGFVETLFGRKRFLPDINSRNNIVKGFAERNAINAPIQGSAADIIKKAMIDIYAKLNKTNYKTKMILQVHDELVFDVYKPELNDIKLLVKESMENVIKLSIPLTVEMGVGENWLEAH